MSFDFCVVSHQCTCRSGIGHWPLEIAGRSVSLPLYLVGMRLRTALVSLEHSRFRACPRDKIFCKVKTGSYGHDSECLFISAPHSNSHYMYTQARTHMARHTHGQATHGQAHTWPGHTWPGTHMHTYACRQAGRRAGRHEAC